MVQYYGTTNGFSDYCNNRGIVPPSDVTASVTAALLVSSEWIDGVYRSYFTGTKSGGRSQDREWPRDNAFDIYRYPIPDDVVPIEIEYATYEASLRQFDNPGGLSVDYIPSKYRSVTVHGAISAEYVQGADVYDMQPHFAKIDQILSPLLSRSVSDSSIVGKAMRV